MFIGIEAGDALPGLFRSFANLDTFAKSLDDLVTLESGGLPPEGFCIYTVAMEETYKIYPHNPPHLFTPDAVYMVTGATLHKKPFLEDGQHKALFCRILFERAKILGWELQAWAVLDNHYHFVAQAPGNAITLVRLIREVHSISAIGFNRMDNLPGRRVWYNYWDSCIDYEASYPARLHYVHLNPVKHGLVRNAEEYEFCSYRWFLENGQADFNKRVMEQPIDRIQIIDDF